METIIKALDELLVGEYIGRVQEKLTESFENQLHDFISYKEEIMYAMLQLLTQSLNQHNYILSGKSNILKQPEFNDLDKAYHLFNMIEADEIVKVIEADEDSHQLTVKIGQKMRLRRWRIVHSLQFLIKLMIMNLVRLPFWDPLEWNIARLFLC